MFLPGQPLTGLGQPMTGLGAMALGQPERDGRHQGRLAQGRRRRCLRADAPSASRPSGRRHVRQSPGDVVTAVSTGPPCPWQAPRGAFRRFLRERP
jgi:hypothetical protein